MQPCYLVPTKPGFTTTTLGARSDNTNQDSAGRITPIRTSPSYDSLARSRKLGLDGCSASINIGRTSTQLSDLTSYYLSRPRSASTLDTTPRVGKPTYRARAWKVLGEFGVMAKTRAGYCWDVVRVLFEIRLCDAEDWVGGRSVQSTNTKFGGVKIHQLSRDQCA